jgi:hypothetical protein
MFTWGLIVFVGLWLILRDINPITRAKLMGPPLIIHIVVIGSGLAIPSPACSGRRWMW